MTERSIQQNIKQQGDKKRLKEKKMRLRECAKREKNEIEYVQ